MRKGNQTVPIFVLTIMLLFFFIGCDRTNSGDLPPNNDDRQNPGEVPVITARELIDNRCGSCHNVNDRVFVVKRARDSYPGIIARMAEKSPGLLSEQELNAVVEYLQELYNQR